MYMEKESVLNQENIVYYRDLVRPITRNFTTVSCKYCNIFSYYSTKFSM